MHYRVYLLLWSSQLGVSRWLSKDTRIYSPLFWTLASIEDTDLELGCSECLFVFSHLGGACQPWFTKPLVLGISLGILRAWVICCLFRGDGEMRHYPEPSPLALPLITITLRVAWVWALSGLGAAVYSRSPFLSLIKAKQKGHSLWSLKLKQLLTIL